MMYSAYKLNKQGGNIQPWFTPFPIWNQSTVSSEKAMATHSSVLAWRILGMGEPGGLPSMGSHRVRHDWSNLAAAAAALSCMSCLYILEINPFSVISFTIIFSHSEGCLFTLLIVSFYVLAIVNSAAVSNGIHVSFSIFVSSGYMPRSGIAGSYGSFIHYWIFKESPYCLP